MVACPQTGVVGAAGLSSCPYSLSCREGAFSETQTASTEEEGVEVPSGGENQKSWWRRLFK